MTDASDIVDPASGELLLGAALRVGPSSTPATLATLPRSCSLGRELVDVTPIFHGERLVEVRLELDAGADLLERNLRHVAWLARSFGPPPVFHARGAMWEHAWGWLYVIAGSARVVYPGPRARVPLPTALVPATDVLAFRCLGCGSLTDLPYSWRVLEAGKNRGAAPCEACGAVSWVQAGSMTEFYRWSNRDEVCEVGNHETQGVRRFTLVPRAPLRPKPGVLQVSALYVKACPEHVAVLRRDGVMGFVLREDV